LTAKGQARLKQIQSAPLPRHVAIIMDGNGRWAKQLDKDRTFGHRQGVETARRIVEFCVSPLKLEALTLYAFSTENWLRPRREVDFLMELMQRFLREQVNRMVRQNVKLRVLGEIDKLPALLQQEIQRALNMSDKNTGLQLNIAVNYGGRQEILSATRHLAKRVWQGELALEDIDEAAFQSALYTQGLPDPDVVIRTAEQRLSNFMLWQAAYAEFWTTTLPWPEFTVEEFLRAISDFQRRHRTFGGV